MQWLMGKIFNNFVYKAAALTAAVILWFFVQREEVLEVTRRLEVSVEAVAGVIVKEPKVHLRDVTLRGPRSLLGNFPDQALTAVIRIPSGRLGAMRFRLDRDFLPDLDKRIRLTIHDPYVAVFVDEKITKTVRVRPSLIGEITPTHRMLGVTVVPPEVKISGLKSELLKITEVPTEPIDIQGLDAGKELSAPLSHLLPYDFESAVEVVKVTIHIEPRQPAKIK